MINILSRSINGPTMGKDDKTRRKLLKAGKALFAARGFRGVTVRAIACEADVNLSLVSYHFGGKEGLYRACLESFVLERITSSTRLLDAPETEEAFRVRLEMFVAEQFDIFVKEPEIVMMVIQEYEEGTKLGRNLYETTFLSLIESMQTYFERAIEGGLLRGAGDARLVTRLCLGLICNIFRSAGKGLGPTTVSTLKDRTERNTIARHVTAMTIGGFEAQR